MRLPNLENAIVPRAKVTEYLLSPTHPVGRFKAEFFVSHGFTLVDWERLVEALLRLAADHDVVKVEDTPFGIRYVIEGALISPDERSPLVRTVWFMEKGETFPRFVTAYPCRRAEG